MPPRRLLAATTLAVAFTFTAALPAPAPALEPDQILRFVPAPVNAVAVVNVAAILRTPRAIAGGWEKMDHTEYLAGAVPVNPGVDRLILATEFVPSHPGHANGLAVASTVKPLDLDALAKSAGAEIVTVGGEKVVESKTGSFFVPLGSDLVGVMRTQHAPDVSRWMKYAKTAEKSQQPLYINQAVYNFGSKFHVLVAIDTADLIRPAQARTAVAVSKVSEADRKSADAVEQFVVGLTGVRFSANIGETGIDATIRIDSSVTPTMPPELMKGFILETLDRNGAHLEDLTAAAVKIEANTVILTFQVTDEELAKIMSIFVPAVAGLDDAQRIAITPAGVNAEASKRYFQNIGRVLDDLRSRNEKGHKYDAASLWYQTAATKIATMSIINADPELLSYSAGVAGRLNVMSDSLRGVPIRADQLDRQTYAYQTGGGGWGWGRWGWGGGNRVYTNVFQIQGEIQQLVAKDKQKRDSLWAQIDEERGKARQAMAKKYGSDFERPKR